MILREILDEIVEDNIRQRGYFYFIKKAVSNLKYTAKKASATVKGTKDYTVEIEFNENNFQFRAGVHVLIMRQYMQAYSGSHICTESYRFF